MPRKTPLLALAVALAGPPLAAQSVDDIVSQNLKARGGLDKIKAVQSVRMTGRITVGPGMEAPFVLEMKRPRGMRMEFTFQGMTGIQAYDGTTAWMVMPFMGKKDPEAIPAEDARMFEEQSDFDGPLVDYKTKGHSVELMGKEKVEGTDAYKLKVTLKNGDVRYLFLDADSFLEIRGEGKRRVRGSEIEGESSISDYKEVGGLMLPHAIESGPKGAPQRQRMTIEKVEINPAIDGGRFKMPAPAAPTPKP